MITLSIFWALVLALFVGNGAQPSAPENKLRSPPK